MLSISKKVVTLCAWSILFVVSHVNGATAADSAYIICRGDTGKMAEPAACVQIYSVSDSRICAGETGEACSSESYGEICRLAGPLAQQSLPEYSSGIGTLETEAACLAKCEQEYGGAMAQFGGRCLGLILGTKPE